MKGANNYNTGFIFMEKKYSNLKNLIIAVLAGFVISMFGFWNDVISANFGGGIIGLFIWAILCAYDEIRRQRAALRRKYRIKAH